MIGDSFSITLSQGRAKASAVLLTGLSKSSWAGGSLPWSLAPMGAKGCNLLVDPRFPVDTVLSTTGKGTIPITIPNIAMSNAATSLIGD